MGPVKMYVRARMFAMFDFDGSGEIELEEFSAVTKAIGLGLTDHQVKTLFAEVDADDSGSVDLEEFFDLLDYYDHTSDARRSSAWATRSPRPSSRTSWPPRMRTATA